MTDLAVIHDTLHDVATIWVAALREFEARAERIGIAVDPAPDLAQELESTCRVDLLVLWDLGTR